MNRTLMPRFSRLDATTGRDLRAFERLFDELGCADREQSVHLHRARERDDVDLTVRHPSE
jgi:hypothetical protein